MSDLDSDVTKQAIENLSLALRQFDTFSGTGRPVAEAVSLLIDSKIDDAIEELVNRIEQASGLRP